MIFPGDRFYSRGIGDANGDYYSGRSRYAPGLARLAAVGAILMAIDNMSADDAELLQQSTIEVVETDVYYDVDNPDAVPVPVGGKTVVDFAFAETVPLGDAVEMFRGLVMDEKFLDRQLPEDANAYGAVCYEDRMQPDTTPVQAAKIICDYYLERTEE